MCEKRLALAMNAVSSSVRACSESVAISSDLASTSINTAFTPPPVTKRFEPVESQFTIVDSTKERLLSDSAHLKRNHLVPIAQRTLSSTNLLDPTGSIADRTPSSIFRLLQSSFPMILSVVHHASACTAAEIADRCSWWTKKQMKLPTWIAPLFIQREKKLFKNVRKDIKSSVNRAQSYRVCTRLNDIQGQHGGRAPCINVCECVLCGSKLHGAFWCEQQESGNSVSFQGVRWMCPFQADREREIAALANHLQCNASVVIDFVDDVIEWQRTRIHTPATSWKNSSSFVKQQKSKIRRPTQVQVLVSEASSSLHSLHSFTWNSEKSCRHAPMMQSARMMLSTPFKT